MAGVIATAALTILLLSLIIHFITSIPNRAAHVYLFYNENDFINWQNQHQLTEILQVIHQRLYYARVISVFMRHHVFYSPVTNQLIHVMISTDLRVAVLYKMQCMLREKFK